MPYCAQCGKDITEILLIVNSGVCDECMYSGKGIDKDILKLSIQQNVDRPTVSVNKHKLEKCITCKTPTSVHCEECGAPICQTHIHIFQWGRSSSPHIMCESCCSKFDGFKYITLCSILVLCSLFGIFLRLF